MALLLGAILTKHPLEYTHVKFKQKYSMCIITMYDRWTDPIGLQTSVGREFDTTYNLKIINNFTLFNFMAFKTIWRLFNKYCSKYCSGFLHQKPCKFIFYILYLKNSCFENVTF